MTQTFAPNCSLLVNNAAGVVQSLPDERVSGKERMFVERIALAAQNAADNIMVARLPFGSVPLSINVSVSATLGASTLAFGDTDNNSRFSAAGTYTSTNGTTDAINVATKGVPLTTCWKYDGTSSRQYEDILAYIGVSSLPSSGTLVVVTKYLDYSS